MKLYKKYYNKIIYKTFVVNIYLPTLPNNQYFHSKNKIGHKNNVSKFNAITGDL